MTVSPREWSERFLLSGCYFRPAGRRKYESGVEKDRGILELGCHWSGYLGWDGMGWDEPGLPGGGVKNDHG
jgi:hypothetical protein